MREVSLMNELLLGMLAAVAFLPTTLSCYESITKNPYAAYDEFLEKSALETDAEIIETSFSLSKDDIMLSLLISDKFTPSPKFIKVCDGYTFQLGASSHLKLVDNFKLDSDDILSTIDSKKIEKCWSKYKDEGNDKEQEWALRLDDEGIQYWEIVDKEVTP